MQRVIAFVLGFLLGYAIYILSGWITVLAAKPEELSASVRCVVEGARNYPGGHVRQEDYTVMLLTLCTHPLVTNAPHPMPYGLPGEADPFAFRG